MNELLTAIIGSISGLSAMLTAAFGVVVVLREIRNRERKVLNDTISNLRQKLATARENELVLIEYAHALRRELTVHDIDVQTDRPALKIYREEFPSDQRSA